MKAADIPQTNNSTVEVESFTCYFPLTDRIILDKEVKVIELGALKVQGFAKRYPNALGDIVIVAEIKRIRFNGLDVAPILTHWKSKGVMDDVQAFAEKHVLTVTFAPKSTAEAVLKAIKETVYGIRDFEPLSFPTISVRLSDRDNDVVLIEGLVVTIKDQLIVLDGSGNGHPLELTDVNAEKMIAGIYKGLEKRFPNQIKAIA